MISCGCVRMLHTRAAGALHASAACPGSTARISQRGRSPGYTTIAPCSSRTGHCHVPAMTTASPDARRDTTSAWFMRRRPTLAPGRTSSENATAYQPFAKPRSRSCESGATSARRASLVGVELLAPAADRVDRAVGLREQRLLEVALRLPDRDVVAEVGADLVLHERPHDRVPQRVPRLPVARADRDLAVLVVDRRRVQDH